MKIKPLDRISSCFHYPGNLLVSFCKHSREPITGAERGRKKRKGAGINKRMEEDDRKNGLSPFRYPSRVDIYVLRIRRVSTVYNPRRSVIYRGPSRLSVFVDKEYDYRCDSYSKINRGIRSRGMKSMTNADVSCLPFIPVRGMEQKKKK